MDGVDKRAAYHGCLPKLPIADDAPWKHASDALQFPVSSIEHVLTGILREGPTRKLARAVEAEAAGCIERHAGLRDEWSLWNVSTCPGSVTRQACL